MQCVRVGIHSNSWTRSLTRSLQIIAFNIDEVEMMVQSWWKPKRVASALGISEREARRLMRNGAIRSQLYIATDDGRQYYRTTESAVLAYQARLGVAATPEMAPVDHRTDFERVTRTRMERPARTIRVR